MIRPLRLVVLIVAVGVTTYLVFPTLQLQLFPPPSTNAPCGPGRGFWTPPPNCGQTDEVIASEQRQAWFDFARVEVIVIVAAAALWVLIPVIVQSLQRPPRSG